MDDCPVSPEPTRAWEHETWVDVQPFFTEQGAEDYLAINRHNLRLPRIYVKSAYRNVEWQYVRDELIPTMAALEGVCEETVITLWKKDGKWNSMIGDKARSARTTDSLLGALLTKGLCARPDCHYMAIPDGDGGCHKHPQ